MRLWVLLHQVILLLHRFSVNLGLLKLLATNAEVADGKYTGKVAGLPCYQKGKLARLDQWLAGRSVLSLGHIQIQLMIVFYLNMQRMRLQ
jgi:hypothetical protein